MTDSIRALKLFSAEPAGIRSGHHQSDHAHLSGTALAQQMMEIRDDIAIILCTGFSEATSPEQTMDIGIREFVMKPIARNEMAAAVRRALGQE
jgi:FixJ family two-component response regulator